MPDRGLILFPNGVVDEVDEDGYTTSSQADGLWEELEAAGYPKFVDESSGGLVCFDISVDAAGQVTAYTVDDQPGNREHPMGAVTPKLALWLRLTAEGS